ncbi:hypothetical protein C8Q77DRAFT_1158865 [Trametes polyzona]|nr:hypothetical protein C8Q77DRAFT_1158865 [Trametes polyzona]
MTPTEYAAWVKETDELRTTFYVGIASFTALVWDHFITFGDEVEYIWKKKKGPLIYLFFLNRYLTPLGFIINLIFLSGMDPYDVSSKIVLQCDHFVRYEGSMTVIGLNTTALMMFLRIYAMYEGKRLVVGFVGAVFCVELGVNAWLMTHGVAVRHTGGITACTMIFDPVKVQGPIASASAWLPLLYDTVVLLFTIKRTYKGMKNPTAGHILRILLKEGVMYYSVIFTITLILTLMIIFAPDGLKNLTAQTEYLMTVAMMSRITLHLKKEAHATWDSLGLYTTDTPSPVTPTGRLRNLGFSGRGTGGTAMNISIQEYSVMHDDQGDEIEVPPASHTRSKPTLATHAEWHELGPVRVSIPNSPRDTESGATLGRGRAL